MPLRGPKFKQTTNLKQTKQSVVAPPRHPRPNKPQQTRTTNSHGHSCSVLYTNTHSVFVRVKKLMPFSFFRVGCVLIDALLLHENPCLDQNNSDANLKKDRSSRTIRIVDSAVTRPDPEQTRSDCIALELIKLYTLSTKQTRKSQKDNTQHCS